MVDGVSEALAVIESALVDLGRTTLRDALRPGIGDAEVRDALRSLRVPVPAGLIALYGWRNGTAMSEETILDDVHLFPGFYLLSVQDAIANFGAFVDDSRWSRNWLPVFANGGGDFYVVETYGSTPGRVRRFRIEELEHPVEFGSLNAMLVTVAQAFERGVFFVDSHGYLEMDDAAFRELAAELNPNVAWWQS